MATSPRERSFSLIPKSVYEKSFNLEEPGTVPESTSLSTRRRDQREHHVLTWQSILLMVLTDNQKLSQDTGWQDNLNEIAKVLTRSLGLKKKIRFVEKYDEKIPDSALHFDSYDFWLNLDNGELNFQSRDDTQKQKDFDAKSKLNGAHN